MLDFELNESTADLCLFYRNTEGDKLVVVLYVDDGIVAATKTSSIDKFLNKLKTEFQITTGSLECFLNVLIKRDHNGSIHISQETYVEGIIRQFRMDDAKPVSTPIERGTLTEEVADVELTAAPYRGSATICLMYLAVAIRLDISYVVNYISQFLEKPEKRHWEMVKRILRYIKDTTGMGIQYDAKGIACQLEGYSDADYASDPNSRRSVSGILFK